VSSPVSSRLCEEARDAAVEGGVVGSSFLLAAPGHAEPGAGQDAGGVSVNFACGAVAVVDRSDPGAGVAAVTGEVGDGFAQLLSHAQRNVTTWWRPACRVDGDGGEGGWCREPAAGVADLDQQLGGADHPRAWQ